MEFIQPAKFSNKKLPLSFQMSPVVLTPKMIQQYGVELLPNTMSLKVFLKIRKSGPKLNKKKGQIGVKSIVFLGHIIPSEGV